MTKHRNIQEKVMIYVITLRTRDLAELTRYKIANNFQVNKNYLSEKFKEGTKRTVLEFINFEKMKRAEKMVKIRTDLSVKEISEILGIMKHKHFREKFKKIYGLNPGKYRSLFKI